ncbi:MAG: hypothetical protein A2381_06510 [Bdellovibrionales bacterium RIFOXYB1_FULL_37_110]|nr:MAG: hypothetical protein A2181_08530 [Bdellovibrionales bacterium RIFOXYA1_FULL_38_20]OFZ50194.1 MAG: hypothetical protein A2417_19360 [Bdellovibrionales bacterium RIFOXYC1_FULL_37_79]OFZ57631.1 MAG: hypothetical protein A2381_06510 [Bdellovibrionales bacterium RIFOXYB1_FULL_37_110]OFZ61398.1 MAG: hypothetical protein A2577_00875 [Bdellovibrionales bacterium RIFOXYD1_FULL_36_51]
MGKIIVALILLSWGEWIMANTFLRQQHDIFLWVGSPNQFFLYSKRPVSVEQMGIYDHEDRNYKIKSVESGHDRLTINLQDKVDFTKNYYLKIADEKIWAYLSMEVIENHFAYNIKDLGARFKGHEVTLKFWSPPATLVKINIFKQDAHTKIFEKLLSRREKGIWYGKLTPQMVGVNSLDGLYYTLEVTSYQVTHTVLDPYALSLSAFSPDGNESVPKAAFIDLDKLKKNRPKKIAMGGACDFIGYEAHVRDFTIDRELEIPIQLKGTFPGFEKVVPSIAKLGVTHIQLMPVQNFYTVKEHLKDYQNADIPTGEINYNWGYDPQHYFALEGWYSTNPSDAYKRISEFLSLVDTIHKNKMGVIIDVVYNHIFEFARLEEGAPGCYLRRDQLGNVSFHTGAGPSVESRNIMVRKLIIESLMYFKNFLGVDGFRFDLMNFLDHQTMQEIRKHLGQDTILYGEAWNFTDLPPEIATTKNNLPAQSDLSVFNDSSRDAYTGRMHAQGYVQGVFGNAFQVRAGIIGAIQNNYFDDDQVARDSYMRFASSPSETINYLTIHDGFTLWDKLNLSAGGDASYRKRLVKNALGLLFTSQGKIILEGGTEMGRSKPLAANDPHPQRAHTSDLVSPENHIVYFHENTYMSPDFTNMINWTRAYDFVDVSDYLIGLIKLRRSLSALRYESAQSITQGLSFIYGNKMVARDKKVELAFFQDKKLETLKLQFINAPRSIRNKQVYLAGEIHSINDCPSPSKNPLENRFHFWVNDDGVGEIVFTRPDIEQFDLASWGDDQKLQFKIIQTPGQWDFPSESYTEFGHNLVALSGITSEGNAVIDLSVVDYGSDHSSNIPAAQIVYLLDNTLENNYASSIEPLDYKKILVIHNVSSEKYTFNLNQIEGTGNFDILVDDQKAGVVALHDSTVKLSDNLVTVLPHSTTVLGR